MNRLTPLHIVGALVLSVAMGACSTPDRVEADSSMSAGEAQWLEISQRPEPHQSELMQDPFHMINVCSVVFAATLMESRANLSAQNWLPTQRELDMDEIRHTKLLGYSALSKPMDPWEWEEECLRTGNVPVTIDDILNEPITMEELLAEPSEKQLPGEPHTPSPRTDEAR
ncbi:MAG: hypothetical protein HOE53_00340 [Candidatus Magasanikbacteria bacterium]|nr:hypothetical protein [Candidatus Magasanikbacteria bacterium]